MPGFFKLFRPWLLRWTNRVFIKLANPEADKGPWKMWRQMSWVWKSWWLWSWKLELLLAVSTKDSNVAGTFLQVVHGLPLHKCLRGTKLPYVTPLRITTSHCRSGLKPFVPMYICIYIYTHTIYIYTYYIYIWIHTYLDTYMTKLSDIETWSLWSWYFRFCRIFSVNEQMITCSK